MQFNDIELVNKKRMYGELPQVMIGDVTYTFDQRLRELRVTDRPWENIKLSLADVMMLELIIQLKEGD